MSYIWNLKHVRAPGRLGHYGERIDELATASPGTHWNVRVDLLKALIQIHTGERKQGIARLEAAVETLRKAEMQDWIVGPLQQHLEAAGQAPTTERMIQAPGDDIKADIKAAWRRSNTRWRLVRAFLRVS